MLKVECEACKAPYQVDEKRVPPNGLKMRCPKCGHTFVVYNPAAAGQAAPAPAPPPARVGSPSAPAPSPAAASSRPAKQTMMGVGSPGGSGPPSSGKPLVGFGGEDPFANLPQAKPGGAAKPFMAKPTLQGMAGGPPPPGPPALGAIDELADLPALPDDVGLPAVPAKKPPPPRPKATLQGTAPPPQGQPPSLQDFQIDLPSPVADLPQAKQAKGGFSFNVDLPSPAADLPSARKGGRGVADLPSPAASLPVAKRGGGGFGEIDLPSVGGNLPAVPERDHNLPVVGGALPAVAGRDHNLPVVGGSLPVAQPRDHNLPSAAGVGLPTAAAPGHNLPSVLAPNQNLPVAMNDDRHLPAVIGADRHLPSLKPGDDFAELDLPPSIPPPALGGALGGVGDELDLPPARGGSMPAPQSGSTRATGGTGFGEVDLGGGGGDVAIHAEEPARKTSGRPGAEAALPTAPVKKRERVVEEEGPPSKAPKIVLVVLAVLVVAGMSLQLSDRYGAFGRLIIGDLIHEGEWRRMADDAAAKTRKAMASDVFAQGRSAVDEVGVLHNHTPRAKAIASYAALAEYEAELRFGRDTDRGARAKGWLDEVQKNAGQSAGEIRFFSLAMGAQAALNDDLVNARRALEAGSKKDVGDPIQQDIALTRGEIELLAKDAAAAGAAFRKAADMASSPRAHFGLARAYAMGGEVDKARVELRAVLDANPLHPGALTLRASLAWERDRNEAAAVADVNTVIDGKAKGTASPGDLSDTYALRGWIEAARGRSADARASFDQAIKLDPHNVSALLGQGEVLYSDGRYTEALARFDTAVQVDPTNPIAIASDAKAKISLDRLADAKTQLTAARQASPNDMHVAYWLGKAEEALGNQKAAEDDYTAAIGLSDPKASDAILPYVALSEQLAKQGRATEAQAKLDDARAKLPDSASMQRALGEVAAVQGLYDQAIQHLQAAVAKDPQDLSSKFQLGVTYRRMQKLDLASEQFDQVYAADKDYPSLAMERGTLYEQSGQTEKALAQFSAALQKSPDDLDLQLRIGAAYVFMNRPDDALPMLSKVFDKRPNSAEANYFLGRASFQKGNIPAGTLRLKRATELDPNRPEYHLYYAWISNDSGQLGVAQEEVKKAYDLDRLNGDVYWQRGALERKQSAVDDAIRDLKKALQLKPTRTEAHATLALCYEDKNQMPLAMAEWQRAIASDDEEPEWRYHYGKLLLDHGKAGASLDHLVYAVTEGEKKEKMPAWLNDAEFNAAESLKKAGRKADAIEHYKRFLQQAPVTSPDRPDALRALRALGAPYEE